MEEHAAKAILLMPFVALEQTMVGADGTGVEKVRGRCA